MANDVTLLIKLNDQASRLLAKITGNTKKLERANNSAQNSIRRINRGIKDTGRAADKAAKGVGTLGKAVRGLVAGFGAFQAGKFVIFKTAELERQTKSLEVLTGSLGNARNIISELQDFGAVTPFTSSELIETAKRLKAFGFETEEVVGVTKRLADVAGATGADLGGIATAFGQIQAKGRLQGEELLQLQERGVSLQDELQKMYGLTADEFRKALEGGRISADAVNLALQNITDTGGKYANGAIAQSDTLAGKFSTLADQVERLAQKIGERISPALKTALTLAINTVDNINRAFAAASITDQQKQLFKQEAEQEVMRFAGPMPGGPFGAGEVVVRHLGKTYKGSASSVVSQITNDLINREVQSRVEAARGPALAAPAIATVPNLLPGGGGGGGDSGGGGAADPLASLKQQIQALKDGVALAQTRTEEEAQQQTLLNKIAALTRIRTDENAALVDEAIKLSGELFYQEGLQKKAADADAEKARRLAEQNQLYQQIGQTIQSGLVQGIQDAITGAKSLGESLSGILKSVGGMFLNAGIGGLGKALKIPGFGMAEGGYVSGPTPALVGEGGEPEYVIPSSKMNEAMGRYSRGARGGAVIPDGPGGDASGGMTGGGGSIDVSYSVERINNVNYVTAAEFERGMAQAAKRGAELGRRNVYSDLVNKRSVRSRVGV